MAIFIIILPVVFFSLLFLAPPPFLAPSPYKESIPISLSIELSPRGLQGGLDAISRVWGQLQTFKVLVRKTLYRSV